MKNPLLLASYFVRAADNAHLWTCLLWTMKCWWQVSSFKWIALLAQGILLLLTSSPAPALTFSHSHVIPCLVPVSISSYLWTGALEFSMRRAAPGRRLTWVMLLMIPKGTLPYSFKQDESFKDKKKFHALYRKT